MSLDEQIKITNPGIYRDDELRDYGGVCLAPQLDVPVVEDELMIAYPKGTTAISTVCFSIGDLHSRDYGTKKDS